MTAIVTLQQLEQGLLLRDVPVSAYMGSDMSQQPGMADSLKAEHTLNMTRGLVDYFTQTGHDGDGRVRLFIDALVLAGRLVELCSSEPSRTYMDGAVWTPLGMEDTTLGPMTVVNSGNYDAWDGLRWHPDTEFPFGYLAPYLR